ncbi:MAG TPA: hypothetical protein VGL91_14410 [Acidobacteriota bacterium]|jgi:hypothetical protein
MKRKADLVAERSVKVADEVWVATALLHVENPGRDDFTTKEIVQRAEKESLHVPLRPGVYVHVVQHCVANRTPDPGKYRMLFATGRQTRRLFRTGDSYHPDRREGKILPGKDDIPAHYHYLLDWYSSQYATRKGGSEAEDPILALCGLGKEIWDETPDDYVRRLRKGWD